jgi:hypothetical protein
LSLNEEVYHFAAPSAELAARRAEEFAGAVEG